jgi:hypothetical protein
MPLKGFNDMLWFLSVAWERSSTKAAAKLGIAQANTQLFCRILTRIVFIGAFVRRYEFRVPRPTTYRMPRCRRKRLFGLPGSEQCPPPGRMTAEARCCSRRRLGGRRRDAHDTERRTEKQCAALDLQD